MAEHTLIWMYEYRHKIQIKEGYGLILTSLVITMAKIKKTYLGSSFYIKFNHIFKLNYIKYIQLLTTELRSTAVPPSLTVSSLCCTEVQSNLDISNSDISNSAKLEAAI